MSRATGLYIVRLGFLLGLFGLSVITGNTFGMIFWIGWHVIEWRYDQEKDSVP